MINIFRQTKKNANRIDESITPFYKKIHSWYDELDKLIYLF